MADVIGGVGDSAQKSVNLIESLSQELDALARSGGEAQPTIKSIEDTLTSLRNESKKSSDTTEVLTSTIAKLRERGKTATKAIDLLGDNLVKTHNMMTKEMSASSELLLQRLQQNIEDAKAIGDPGKIAAANREFREQSEKFAESRLRTCTNKRC